MITGSCAQHWKLRVVILPTLSSLGAPHVIRMTTYYATSDDKIGIMIHGFPWNATPNVCSILFSNKWQVLSIIIYCGIYSIRVNLLSKCHVNWHFTLFTKPNHTMSQLIPSCNHRVESHILMMNCRFTTSKSRDSQVGNTCCFRVYNRFT